MAKDLSWKRYLPLPEWPRADQAAWQAAIAKGNVLDGRGPAHHWREATRCTNVHHYGRWLAYLRHVGCLEADQSPAQRVTRSNLKPYVANLQAEVAPRTVVSSLVGLKVMLKVMAPQEDWRWLADICNALNRSSSPQKEKRSRMRPTGEIYATAIAELERLLTTSLRRRLDRVGYRDALMLAMLAARPLRLKNFTNIALGRHLHMSGDGWLLVIPGEEVKGGRPLEFTLPVSLAPFLQVYLERVRPSFLGGKPGDALWLTYQGGPLDSSSVNWRFMLTSRRLIGVHINPHLLRDCAATSLSTVSPAAALAAAPLLGHSNFATTERYYIRANQLEAGRRLNSMLSSLKSSLK